jgi:hypothetical protein
MAQGRITSSALCIVVASVVASIAIFAETAAARSQFGGFAHAGFIRPSGASRYMLGARPPGYPMRMPSPHGFGRDTPSSQFASRPYASRYDASSARAPEFNHDYRQMRADDRYAPNRYADSAHAPMADQAARTLSANDNFQSPRNDYRQFRAGSQFVPNNYTASGNAAIAQPAYVAGASAAGNGTATSSVASTVGGLVADMASSLITNTQAGTTREMDQSGQEFEEPAGN